jgi:hypothetical protein
LTLIGLEAVRARQEIAESKERAKLRSGIPDELVAS